MKSTDEVKNPEAWRSYEPKKPPRSLEFFRGDLSLLQLIPVDEAGKVLLTALEKADEYANSYSETINPDFSGMSTPAQIIGGRLFEGFKRGLDAYRKTAYYRSQENGGGTAAKTQVGENNHPSYMDVDKYIHEHSYKCTAQQFFARMEQTNWTRPEGKPVDLSNWQSAVLLFESGKI